LEKKGKPSGSVRRPGGPYNGARSDRGKIEFPAADGQSGPLGREE